MATLPTPAYYSFGPYAKKVPLALHKRNRERLCEHLRELAGVPSGAIVVLKGGVTMLRHSTDHEIYFRQESYMHWLFGVLEPDCWGAVEVDTGNSILFMPDLPADYAVWMGTIHPPEHFKMKYDVDEVHFTKENHFKIVAELKKKNASKLLLLRGINTDSGNPTEPADFNGIDQFELDYDHLFNIISELRVMKTDMELDVMRYVTQVSCNAHKKVMKAVKPLMTQYQAESIFEHSCFADGACKLMSYDCIGASGAHCATLHYGHAGNPNDKVIQNGDMCLFDMGCEYYCYGSDVTCSFPVNGHFTDDQKMVYEAVLAASRAVMDNTKEGVCWVDNHRLAERVILIHLKNFGMLKGDVDDMMRAHMGAIFMPHGLGHFIGIDTHDVGGYPPGVERPTEPGLESLRTARNLKAGMAITIEPGCYFIDMLMDQALDSQEQSAFIEREVFARFRRFGGVRIEDDVVVREHDCELLSHSLPRTVSEIQVFMGAKS
ncbi:xaa-Pro dipeptidase-like [Oscarella lobularis]|uniref:xaa-Pro dipeptidase-like n=1 Tax=Oscarella lobularis TaxID=121494 RepID=UPI003313FC59